MALIRYIAAALVLTPLFGAETELSTLTVTATRTETDISDTPASVSVITREEIKARDAAVLNEIIGLDSGISFARQGNKNTVSIRGFSADQTLILIDGKRLSKEPSQKFELDRIMLQNVERIEILKGPSSALYGADAMGGVINIITTSPTTPAASMQVRYGTYEKHVRQHEIGFNIQSGKLGNLAVALSGSLLDYDPYFHPEDDNVSLCDEQHLQSAAFKADYRLNEANRLELTADITDDRSDYRYRKVNKKGEWSSLVDEDDNTRINMGTGWYYTDHATEGNLRLYYSGYEKHTDTRNTGNGKLFGTASPFKYIRVDTYTMETLYSQALFDEHLVTVGADYRHERFKGTTIDTGRNVFEVTRDGITLNASEADTDYYGGFAQDQLNLSETLYLIASLRFDGSSRFGSEWSPRIGASYTLWQQSADTLYLKANYSEGYRVPTMRDLYVNTAQKSGNPDLEPEYSSGYEIGLALSLDPLRAGINWFHTDVDNLITDIAQGAGEPRQYVNIAKTDIHGIETQLDYRFTPEVYLGADYTYLSAQDEAGEQLEDRPEHKVVGRASYNSRTLGLQGKIWGEYLAGVPVAGILDAQIKDRAYGTVNAVLTKKASEQLLFSAGIDNITDTKAYDIPLMGRFYYFSVRIEE